LSVQSSKDLEDTNYRKFHTQTIYVLLYNELYSEFYVWRRHLKYDHRSLLQC